MIQDYPVPPELFEAATKAADLPLVNILIEVTGPGYKVHCRYSSDIFQLERKMNFRRLRDEDFLDLASHAVIYHVYNHGDKPLRDHVVMTTSCPDIRNHACIFTVTFMTPNLLLLSTILERVARRKCDFEFGEALEKTLNG